MPRGIVTRTWSRLTLEQVKRIMSTRGSPETNPDYVTAEALAKEMGVSNALISLTRARRRSRVHLRTLGYETIKK